MMSEAAETLEATRSRDELANLRKVLAEIKISAANTRDMGGAVTQLASRVEKLEKEQGVRLDKLGDRIDRDAATVSPTYLAARQAGGENRAARPRLSPRPSSSSPRRAPGCPMSRQARSIVPAPRLRNFFLAEMHNGYAMIDSPAGEFAVAPGDIVPAAAAACCASSGAGADGRW